MWEHRALTERLRSAFEAARYGEVWTPSPEYEEVLDQYAPPAPATGSSTSTARCWRCAPTATIPIARVVACATPTPSLLPLLLFRACVPGGRGRGAGQQREFLQGGGELIGVPAPEGEAEVIALCISALEEAGLRRHRLGGRRPALPAPVEGVRRPGGASPGAARSACGAISRGLEMRVDRPAFPARTTCSFGFPAPWRSRGP